MKSINQWMSIAMMIAFTAVLGCRREDFREVTVEIPGLSEANKPKVVEVLSKYNGIDQNSYKWDFTKKTLTLMYDSMKIAQANIRYAIDEQVTKVKFPEKKDNHAGY